MLDCAGGERGERGDVASTLVGLGEGTAALGGGTWGMEIGAEQYRRAAKVAKEFYALHGGLSINRITSGGGRGWIWTVGLSSGESLVWLNYIRSRECRASVRTGSGAW